MGCHQNSTHNVSTVGSKAGHSEAKGVFLDITRPKRPCVDREPNDDDVEEINAPPALLITERFLKPVDELKRERRRQFVKAAQQAVVRETCTWSGFTAVIARVLADNSASVGSGGQEDINAISSFKLVIKSQAKIIVFIHLGRMEVGEDLAAELDEFEYQDGVDYV